MYPTLMLLHWHTSVQRLSLSRLMDLHVHVSCNQAVVDRGHCTQMNGARGHRARVNSASINETIYESQITHKAVLSGTGRF